MVGGFENPSSIKEMTWVGRSIASESSGVRKKEHGEDVASLAGEHCGWHSAEKEEKETKQMIGGNFWRLSTKWQG